MVLHYIYRSQTACYAEQRKEAIDHLGDAFCCVCNPEIMDAFVYALNDADERVRAEAADEIGDQLRKHRDCCCCDEQMICALAQALADCSGHVRQEAREALGLCGVEIVDAPCCSSTCTPSCNSTAPAPQPNTYEESAPAPAPPAPAATQTSWFSAAKRALGRF